MSERVSAGQLPLRPLLSIQTPASWNEGLPGLIRDLGTVSCGHRLLPSLGGAQGAARGPLSVEGNSEPRDRKAETSPGRLHRLAPGRLWCPHQALHPFHSHCHWHPPLLSLASPSPQDQGGRASSRCPAPSGCPWSGCLICHFGLVDAELSSNVCVTDFFN